jgi:BirA family biotin operon repressor/biotin-[acetyl-CoA-carboxylase] ligase
MIIGNKLQILPSCHSTNQFLREKFKTDLINGELVCARDQTSGRGQRGNSWESEPNENLTFSFFLKLDGLSINQQFSLNYFVSLAILDFLEMFLPENEKLELKWPNDVYYNKKKICGILIENQVKETFVSNSVIGIGININQIQFVTERATSIALETKQNYVVEEALGLIVRSLNKYFSIFLEDKSKLKKQYLSRLMGFEKLAEYIDNNQNISFLGEIVEVEDSGALVVLRNGERVSFGLKEISFVL